MKQIKTGKWQRQWALTKATSKLGSKLASGLAVNMLSEPFNSARRNTNNQALYAEQANAFSQALGELKGSVVKIGQMMAVYGEFILPPAIISALSELEEQTEAFSSELILPKITAVLADAEQWQIEEEALGAASLSQVHRAKSADLDVCFKVQYPGILDTVSADLAAIGQLLKLARVVNIKGFDSWLLELDELLRMELDYQHEADMTERFARLLRESVSASNDLDVFSVPKLYRQYCDAEVLCLEFMPGESLHHIDLSTMSLARRNRMARAFLQLFFYEIFEWQLLQTDPNFGNFRVCLSSAEHSVDSIALLDFGAARRLDSQFVLAVKAMIIGSYQQDFDRTISGAEQLGLMQAHFPEDVKESFYQLCQLLMEPFLLASKDPQSDLLNQQGEYCWSRANLPKRVAKLAAQSAISRHFEIPPKEFALLSRKLIGVYSIVANLKAEFNPNSIIERWSDEPETLHQ